MNITIDAFINGLNQSSRELKNVLANWHSIDQDLQEEYIEQLRWMLDELPEVYRSLNNSNKLIDEAMVLLQELEAELKIKMGIVLNFK